MYGLERVQGMRNEIEQDSKGERVRLRDGCREARVWLLVTRCNADLEEGIDAEWCNKVNARYSKRVVVERVLIDSVQHQR